MSEYTKYVLSDKDIPSAWVNILPRLKEPMDPPLHPATGKPLGPEDLAPIFPMSLIEQEFSPQAGDRHSRAKCSTSTSSGGPRRCIARAGWRRRSIRRRTIYYKYEGTSPAGSHKPNTAVPQAFYNKQAGIKRLATETGAGQWGSALALACQMFGLECTVYMVKVSYDQKPYRRMMMNTWGAEVFASPSTHTQLGRAILAAHPDSPGSLGIAISEAVEDAATHRDTNYSLGSVLNHVMLHQTVIGQEAKLADGAWPATSPMS